MTLLQRFVSNIKKMRTKQGRTQGDVAGKAGISISYLSMLERGQRSPPLDTVDMLGKALGVEPLSLLR